MTVSCLYKYIVTQRIKELEEKNAKLTKEVEAMSVKVAELNVFDLIKDSGDGTVDASKILVAALESKVFKKFSLLDEKIKDSMNEVLKAKNGTINNKNEIDGLSRLITKLRDDLEDTGNKNQENVELLHKEDSNITASMKEATENLQSNITKLQEDLEKKISQIQYEINDKIIALESLPISSVENNKATSSKEGDIFDDNKFKALAKKVNDVENLVRQIMNSKALDEVSNTVKSIQFDLQNRLNHDDLKELYNFHYGDVELINDVKDSINLLYDDNRKAINDIQALNRKMESITANVTALQSMPRGGGDKGPTVDITKFIDTGKFMESTKALYKEIERIRKDNEDNRRNIDDILNQIKTLANADNVNNVETKLTNLITEFKVVVNKKYADKYETNKIIKVLENQMKAIQEDSSKRNEAGDNWLLAKRPLNSFKCASCEANLEHLNSNQEYLPWNKYPARDDKSYRMGSGFSHMLQMMSSELVKNYDKKEFSSDIEDSKRKKRSFSGIRNKVRSGRIALPKVRINKKAINLIDDMPHYSDDENNYSDNYETKQVVLNPTSPKIMKVVKKKKQSNI